MVSGDRSILSTAAIFALGLLVGVGVAGRGNAAQQHVKVAELYKADLVTTEGKEASMFLAELSPGANMGGITTPGTRSPTSWMARCGWRLKAANRSR
jgi:hypothetical protein